MAIPDQGTVIALAILNEIIQQDVDDDDIIFQEISASNSAKHVLHSDNREGPREFSGIVGYVEYTVTGYSDPYFKKHFRMFRGSFEVKPADL
jgi:hypothetical protein